MKKEKKMDIKVDVHKLADQLGVAASKLIEMFAKRAWTEWVDFGIAVAGVVLLFAATIFCYRKACTALTEAKDPFDSEKLMFWAMCTLVLCIFLAINRGVTLSELSQAVKATASPEAYAVERILKRLH